MKYDYLDNKKLSILFLLIFSLIITVISINNHRINIGIYPDMFLYLIQSLRFSGISNFSMSEYTPINAPLIPFLTSILFRIGIYGKTVAFIVDGVFYIIGVIGAYYLLNLRFDNYNSLFGSVLYGSFTSNVKWVSTGLLDIPSASLSILTIYFIILGVEKDKKYIYLSFITLALAFLAKYNSILILPLMIIYPLLKGNFKINIKKYLKDYIIGGILFIIINIPFLIYLNSHNLIKNLIDPFSRLGMGTSGRTGKIASLLVKNDKFYYLTNLHTFINNYQITGKITSIVIILLTIIGLLILLYNNKEKIKSKISLNKFEIKEYYLILLGLLLIIISFYNVEKLSNLINIALSIVGILIISISMNKTLTTEKDKINFNYDTVIVSWIIINIIFFSAILPRMERYSIAFLFPLAVLIVIGFKNLLETKIISNYSKKFNINLKKIIPLIIMVILITSAINYADNSLKGGKCEELEEICYYLEKYDPDYKTKNIWSLHGSASSFYLNKTVHSPHTKTKEGEINQEKMSKIGEEMKENDVDYFISYDKKLEVPNYKKLKTKEHIVLYEKNF